MIYAPTEATAKIVMAGLRAQQRVTRAEMINSVRPNSCECSQVGDDATGVALAERIEAHAHAILSAVDEWREALATMEEGVTVRKEGK